MSGPYTQPLVYSFGQGRSEGTAAMKDILGGKFGGRKPRVVRDVNGEEIIIDLDNPS